MGIALVDFQAGNGPLFFFFFFFILFYFKLRTWRKINDITDLYVLM